ncbi:ATP-binding protein [Pseudoalteromonas denitrificans]|uniref:histidine kinase n=1 Tax=Pseudoalteromonas denitrificans DSM 6059 TaxID=1123010 RepID=A0A1I1F116_9GAMM|nr:ATP-binding protein [Pseudoalteromonas denitrificans]SFB91448.1 Signal transduction histidine kinase [Pseudoalteromonas denitrificans DSM 6059]
MKKLYISLLLSAFVSLFALGWLLDTFSQTSTNNLDDFAWQKMMMQGFSEQIAQVAPLKRTRKTIQLNDHFSQDLTYQKNTTLALPDSLLSELYLPGGLVLEDELGFYLLKSSPKFKDYHLELRLTKTQSSSNNFDLFLTLSFYAGVCILMWIWLSPLTKRLSILNEASQKFASGNLSARIKISKFTYIYDVEAAFNRMAGQIQKLIEENKLLASSMSHDIRTPVACLRFGLDAALDAQDNDKKDRYLERMETDLDQMECMLNSYLEFATLEKNSYQISISPVNLSPYLHDLVRQIKPKLDNKKLIAKIECDSVEVEADLHWLARAVTNLLSNACDFAEQRILIRAVTSNTSFYLTIEDDGPGISPDNWKSVFTPFFKEQTHRDRSNKSYGLGLAIAAKVADWHFGIIKVDKSPDLSGARFTLKLPLRPPIQTNKNS